MYSSKPLFPYAVGYYGILPPGLPDNFYNGEGDHVFTKDYVICFKPETPEDIKQRLIKDYAEYNSKQKESGLY